MAGKLILLSALFFAAGLSAAAPDGQPKPGRGGRRGADEAEPIVIRELPVRDLQKRLSALTPDKPEEYYLLAEEIAAELPGAGNELASARRLAEQLLVLAYELDLRRPEESQQHLGRAACLALASIAPSEADQRWLWALARALDPQTTGPTWAPTRVRPAPESLALDVCAVLGYARAGSGIKAEQILGRPGVGELLERYEVLLSPAGISGGADSIRRTIAQWPACPECKNQRIVKRPGEPGQYMMCHTCGGLPGPSLTAEELLLQLRLESALLSGIHRSWAAQAVVDHSSPLRDLDPAELAPTYGVDPVKPLWRDGQWTAAAGAETTEPPAEQEPKTAEPAPVPSPTPGD